jgi:hypothetical protein
LAAPFVFLYPIIHEYKKAVCVPDYAKVCQMVDLDETAGDLSTEGAQ